MKTYTDAERLAWTVAKNPIIECDERAVNKGSKNAFWIRFWCESKHHVLTGETPNNVIDKAMNYCSIKALINEEYDEHFTVSLGQGESEKTFVFKLPAEIEEISVIQDAYWAACKNMGVCLHEKRSHETYLTLIENEKINKPAFRKLESKAVFVPNNLFDNDEFINLLQNFMMTENESCYLIQVSVPDEVIAHLPSLNKTKYAPTNVILGYS
jgi:hypothetical protein